MVALTEYESKKLLESFGVRVTRESVVTDFEEGCSAAANIGYPIVLKVSGLNTEHKSEIGGVKTGIRDQASLKAAWTELTKISPSISEFLLSEHVEGSREFIAGYHIDPDFGPTIMFGLGGIFTEAITDINFKLLPCTQNDLIKMVSELQSSILLKAFRGEPEVNLELLLNMLEAIATCGLSDPDIIAIDVNPIIISNDHPTAVDALVVLS
tara:strand:- start:140 stop:772 length:633 start_codon:yes stop_codon:yes gene_type:complete